MSAELPKMPEPVAMFVRWSATKNEPANINPWVTVELDNYAPNPGRDEQQLFTAEQMAAHAQEATRLAVERAAQVCDDRRDVAHGRSKSGVGDREIELCSAMEARCCADSIRALLHQSEERHG